MSKDLLGLSDEDFAKLPVPSGQASSAEETSQTEDKQEEPAVTETPSSTGSETENQNKEEEKQEEKPAGEESKSDADEKAGQKAEGAAEVSEAGKQESPKEGEKPSATGSEKKEDPKAEEQAPPDYEGFYNQIMKPFKANGKTIELRTPDEAIKLMQMGANYTKRVQELVPHKKVLTMLQNNNLLDEAKLSYLIDLDKKNPDAIKKLVKDSGVDPLDINTNEEPAYKPSNHSVTDEEVNFVTALEEVGSTPEGKQTLQVINTTWDQTSKEALWKSPDILGVIQSQRDNGVYDQIVAEMDRQKVLGTLSPNTPFLAAYKQVGDSMMERNAFIAKPTPGQPEPTVVATRTAAPKPAVANSDKARAASPTKTSPNKAQEFINPLALSDDEFLKRFEGRL
ncbi:putative tape measure protein [Rhizobium phage RHph_X2_28B]|uniref:tail length tape measure protein n=1 Tax=Rhizobium phage RHph_X2_28B TaxID=2836086 RepID=UPI0023291744|nr:tail length tape measure protein [Rhizobium phage RHph_X2_28B]QWY83527.1 putative tape measure protein [Rhizobium phage RHph_X2_28B]QWY83763.1 putative tape measure protein [Rhizobium phage RHph_X3_15]